MLAANLMSHNTTDLFAFLKWTLRTCLAPNDSSPGRTKPKSARASAAALFRRRERRVCGSGNELEGVAVSGAHDGEVSAVKGSNTDLVKPFRRPR